MAKRQWIIVDIDGTIADVSHRVSLIPDWDAFNAACPEDKPYSNMVKLVAHLSDFYNVLLLTGRSAAFRGPTKKWLLENKVHYNELRMRPETDFTPDIEVKWAEAVKFFGEDVGAKVAFVFEDRDRVVQMWRDRGLTCLQPRAGDY